MPERTLDLAGAAPGEEHVLDVHRSAEALSPGRPEDPEDEEIRSGREERAPEEGQGGLEVAAARGDLPGPVEGLDLAAGEGAADRLARPRAPERW